MTTAPPQIRAALATALAGLGIAAAPGWLDAVLAVAWAVGGVVDYLWTRDRDRDGTPDGVQWAARALGWSEADTTAALVELRRLGPSALIWLRRIAEVRNGR